MHSSILTEQALFNVMLRELEVTGLKLEDVYSLDDKDLAALG